MKYPSMIKQCESTGQTARTLPMAMSPDGIVLHQTCIKWKKNPLQNLDQVFSAQILVKNNI